ncbi:hypothetical protein AB6N23_01970 [Cellulomonas sp. 179-A 9B4 NHS]|uniref:hypothetical protein n=1 Tax=Cellulomonas sp. 179-A 9B4 NHS TaxID=3142379 RepID=UPI00399F0E4E
MATNVTVDEAVARATRAQEARIESIRTLAVARQHVADVREQGARELAELQAQIARRVSDAERDDVRAYRAAEGAGWTADELRKIGFDAPDKVRRTQRRASRRGAATPASDNGTTHGAGARPDTGPATSGDGGAA